MNTKSVQVVMSTYNGEKYLKEQIDSILSQEGVDVRLYIRDDGSSFSKVRTYSIVKRELCPNLLNRAQNNGGWLTHLSAGVVSQSESSSDHTSILKEKSKAG